MKLFFQKMVTAPLYIIQAFLGSIVFFILLSPINIPYLLHVPEEVPYYLAFFLGPVIPLLVAVIIRVQRLRNEDLIEENPDKSLLVRVVASPEYRMEQIVFGVYVAAFLLWQGIKFETPFLPLMVILLIGLVGGGTLFAIVDCLIWMFCYNRIQR